MSNGIAFQFRQDACHKCHMFTWHILKDDGCWECLSCRADKPIEADWYATQYTNVFLEGVSHA